MKKIFLSILSAAIMAACAKSEPENIVPATPEPDDEARMVYVEIDATSGSETKASYDANLHAYWEAGDQILGVQGIVIHDSYTITTHEETVYASTLDIMSGINSRSASFAGDIQENTSDNKYFHFVYPASTTTLYTHGIRKGSSLDHATNTTTCTYTITSEQDGLWHPFLCASTAEQTKAEAISSIKFGKSRNACFAVRVFESDGETPKRIKSITITAENDIIGTLSATTDNNGSFADKTFDANGGGNTITAENLESIEMLGDKYEYRFEVLPVNSGKIHLLLNDEDGSSIERVVNAKVFKENTRSGVNIAWDKAGVNLEAVTWFDDSCAKGELSALNSKTTIYCDIATFGVAAGNIEEKGIIINGDTEHPYIITDAGTKFHTEIAALNGNGEYTALAYIKLKNEAEPLTSTEKKVYIVDEDILPVITSHTIRSSYNTNGNVLKTNDIYGDTIKAFVELNDCWASRNLVNTVTLHYGGFDNTMEIATEFTTEGLNLHSYDNCYIDVVFANGHTLKTPAYTTNVTGIPYSITTDSATPHGWETHNTTTTGSTHLLIEDGGYIVSPAFFASSDCSYGVTASAQVYCYKGSLISATYTLSMQTDPAGNAYLSENLSGGTNTGSSSSAKSIYPHFDTYTKIKIGSTKVKTSGGSTIHYGIRVHSVSVTYN